jgi:outer membrane protein
MSPSQSSVTSGSLTSLRGAHTLDPEDCVPKAMTFPRIRSRIPYAAILIAVMVAAGCSPLSAQQNELTLRRAVEIALERSPAMKMARAEERATRSSLPLARAAMLPQATFTEQYMRGNDPVFAFGTRLRQQRFTSADFALNRLNSPTPVGNFVTRLAAQWTLFNSGADWLGLKRADLAGQAASRQLERNQQEIAMRVAQAYYGALLADRQVEVAEQSVRTAEAIYQRSEARVESGMAVESDRLSSAVALARRKQESIEARNRSRLARSQLAFAMGTTPEDGQRLVEPPPPEAAPLDPLDRLESHALSSRSDLKAIELQSAAQAKTVAIARSAFGPRVNAFGSWQMENPAFTGGGGNNWVGAVELQLDLFAGGAKRANLARERALQEKASAAQEQARAAVLLDVRRAYYDLQSASEQVGVAEAAIAQADESLRVMQNRYESGLLTVSDLLGGEEAAWQAKTAYWRAVYQARLARAGLQLATNQLSAESF